MWPLLQNNWVIFIEFWRKNDLGFQNKKNQAAQLYLTSFYYLIIIQLYYLIIIKLYYLIIYIFYWLFNNNKIVLLYIFFLLNIICYKINVYFKLMQFIFLTFYSSKNSEKKKHSNNFPQKIYILSSTTVFNINNNKKCFLTIVTKYISISNICCSFEISIHQRILKINKINK